jgi:hypothetical protein
MEQLKELVEKLERAFSDRLVSVVLYGSGAQHDQHDRFSDLNILCVLKQITPRELGDGEPVLKWWTEVGHPSVLLMSEEEVHHSSDSFAIEFRDMKDRRKVLFGLDVVAEVHIDMKYHRVQVEHELRSKLLRLRQQAAHVLSNPEALLELCLNSVTTFCTLGRHALVAGGIHPKADRRAVMGQLARTVPMDAAPFEALLDLREDKPVPHDDMVDPGELFARYLESIGRLVTYVDGLEEKK